MRFEGTCPWCQQLKVQAIHGPQKFLPTCSCGARCWLTPDPNPQDGLVELWEAARGRRRDVGEVVSKAYLQRDVDYRETAPRMREVNWDNVNYQWRAIWARLRSAPLPNEAA